MDRIFRTCMTSMFRTATVLAIVTITSSPIPSLADDEPRDTSATVASWNIKRHENDDPSRAEKIAEGIIALDAEVILLTEVRPHSIIDEIMNHLVDMGGGYAYRMPIDGQHPLGIAVVYKIGVEVGNVALLADSDLGNPAEYRKALVADIRVGAFDFHLVGLHLKSGRGESERAMRSRQCAVVAAHVETILDGEEKDVLIVGDYNMIPPQEDGMNDAANFEALNPDDHLRVLSAEFRGNTGTHIHETGRYGNHLDGYAISRNFTKEFVGGSFEIYRLQHAFAMTTRAYANQVSDHLPLVARFDIRSDDD